MDTGDLDFQDRHEWRNWLAQNHDKVKEAWLIFHKKHSGKTGISYDEALEEALCFGWIDGKLQSIDKVKYRLRFSPRKSRSIWSKRNKEKAVWLIEQGKMTDTGLAKIEEAKTNGFWEAPYMSGTEETIPPDLESALFENKIAGDNFHNLARSYRNMFIRWLNSARTEETRKKRISEIVKRAQSDNKFRYGRL